ncbi:MAG: YgiQ family radical SAM protein [Planctomycetaceae bacterium]|nr:YgiQ family radical SAM protein [Planctomycetaceae bacterium]
MNSQPLPLTRREMLDRGWDSVDVVFVTGDAYVDHPSFAAALLARVLEADGLRVAILAQPDWRSAEPWTTFGPPNLAFCVSAGNMDSMINHYTANRKVRNSDAYSPDGQIGLRPDRATLAYCQRAREAATLMNMANCIVIAGGVEASLRRLAHYDFWSDKVKRSMVLDSKADLLVYGMGEAPLLEILRRLQAGEPIGTIRNVRGTAYRLKKNEDLPEETETTIHLPSLEEVEADKSQFAKMTRLIYENLNPYLGITLVQENDLEAVVVNPPSLPMETPELDRIYALPFTRLPHPHYGDKKIPAFETVKNSICIHRGCFGGCTFCALTAHQGKFIQSRSVESVVAEARETHQKRVAGDAANISDLGGPTANMYALGCKNESLKKRCRRLSCLAPTLCPHLLTDHSALIKLMQTVRKLEGINKVFIASGIRTDLALCDERYIQELTEHHIGGYMKTAPEHTDPTVLELMNKPPIENHDQFCAIFQTMSRKEQYVVPYLMAGFPGTTLAMTVEAAVYLKRNGIRSEQVQEFVPGPFELATCMYYTGLNPITGQPVYVPFRLRERRLQKALLMYDDPNSYHDVKTALRELGREDLIGTGPDCLITAYPPKSLSMRRSSRVKRLQIQNEADKKQKDARRTMYAEQMRQAELERQEKRRAERLEKLRQERPERPERGFSKGPAKRSAKGPMRKKSVRRDAGRKPPPGGVRSKGRKPAR